MWIRRQLCEEAIRLGRLLCELIPRNPELRALLALMLLHDSRRMARAGPDEEIITLEEQDRELWDRREIAEGVPLLESALREGASGEYALQAAIAALHARARRAEDTDWAQIARLYDALLRAAAIAGGGIESSGGDCDGRGSVDRAGVDRRSGGEGRVGRVSFAAGRASGSVASRGSLERGGGGVPAGVGVGGERSGAAILDPAFGGSGRATIGRWSRQLSIEPMRPEDWPAVRAIYLEGIATGNATFEQTAPEWEKWDAGHLRRPRIVARSGEMFWDGLL